MIIYEKEIIENEIVSLAEIKTHCHINIDVEDNILTLWKKSAIQMIEHYLSISLHKKKIDLFIDEYSTEKFELPRGPIITVEEINLYDINNTKIGIDKTTLFYEKNGDAFFMVENTIPLRKTAGVEIIYWAGFTDSNNISVNIKDAILLYCAHRNENRIGELDIPEAFYSLLKKDRVCLV